MRSVPLIVLVAATMLVAGCDGDGPSTSGEREPAGPCDERIAQLETSQTAAKVKVFLADRDSAPEQLEELARDLEGIDGVTSVEVTTKAEAFDRAKELFEDSPEIMEDLPGNPFPASVDLEIDSDRLEDIIEDIEGRDVVDDVGSSHDGVVAKQDRSLIRQYRAGDQQDVCDALELRDALIDRAESE